MAAILDLCQKNYFACLDFSRFLVCYSRNPSGLKTIEKPSVGMCGGSCSILTGLYIYILHLQCNMHMGPRPQTAIKIIIIII